MEIFASSTVAKEKSTVSLICRQIDNILELVIIEQAGAE